MSSVKIERGEPLPGPVITAALPNEMRTRTITAEADCVTSNSYITLTLDGRAFSANGAEVIEWAEALIELARQGEQHE